MGAVRTLLFPITVLLFIFFFYNPDDDDTLHTTYIHYVSKIVFLFFYYSSTSITPTRPCAGRARSAQPFAGSPVLRHTWSRIHSRVAMSALLTLDTNGKDRPNFNVNLSTNHSAKVASETETFERLKSQMNFEEKESLIVTGTSPGFPIIYVSEGWVDMCGWTKTEAKGQGGGINQGAGTSISTLERMGQALREEKACKCQLINYRNDGTPFWNIISIFPIRENGKTVLFAGQLQDYSYHVSKFVCMPPQQYFVPGHKKGEYFMKFLKNDSHLSKCNSHCQDGRENVTRYTPDARPIQCLGFSYGDFEAEYVFHRMIDAAIDLKLTITPDETLPCSAFAWRKEDNGETVSVQIGIKIDWQGNGSFHIERRHGDTFAFHSLYRQLIERMADVIHPGFYCGKGVMHSQF